jgi:hypothetical protein
MTKMTQISISPTPEQFFNVNNVNNLQQCEFVFKKLATTQVYKLQNHLHKILLIESIPTISIEHPNFHKHLVSDFFF